MEFKRKLPVKLTAEEWSERATELAALHEVIDKEKREREEIEAQKKMLLKAADGRIEKLDNAASQIAANVRDHEEERDVMCVEIAATTGEEHIHVVRCDTGEVIQTRSMDHAEQIKHRSAVAQGQLFPAPDVVAQLRTVHGDAWASVVMASVKAAEADGFASEEASDNDQPADDSPGEFSRSPDVDDLERADQLHETYSGLSKPAREEEFARLFPDGQPPQNKGVAVKRMVQARLDQERGAQ